MPTTVSKVDAVTARKTSGLCTYAVDVEAIVAHGQGEQLRSSKEEGDEDLHNDGCAVAMADRWCDCKRKLMNAG